MATHPPEEIDAGPLTLRRWRPEAAEALQAAVLDSLGRLGVERVWRLAR